MPIDPKTAPVSISSAPEEGAGRTRLDALARRYYAPLASFFRKRTRNTAEVQDLVQQVFLRLAQYRALGDIHNPDGYIFQTAANTLKDHFRQTAVRERFAMLAGHLAFVTAPVEAVACLWTEGQRHGGRVNGEAKPIRIEFDLVGDIDVVLAARGDEAIAVGTQELRSPDDSQS